MSIMQAPDTPLAPRLFSAPAGEDDRVFLRDHPQRDALHGSFTREFSAARKKDNAISGNGSPRRG